MTNSDGSAHAFADTIDIINDILKVGTDIAAGDLRSLDDVLASATVHSNSVTKDRQVYARSNIIARQAVAKLDPDLTAALQLMHDDGSVASLQLARQAFKTGTELADRTGFYLALAGDNHAAWRLVRSYIQHVEGRTGRTMALATALGLTTVSHFRDLRKIQSNGIMLLDDIGAEIKDIRGAIDVINISAVFAATEGEKKVPVQAPDPDDAPPYTIDY